MALMEGSKQQAGRTPPGCTLSCLRESDGHQRCCTLFLGIEKNFSSLGILLEARRSVCLETFLEQILSVVQAQETPGS